MPAETNTLRPVEILLAEDSRGDVALTKLVFQDSKFRNNVHSVNDGIQAMKFLRREWPFESAPKPDLILLDVNMPRKNGIETLSEIRSDPAFCIIPVIMLTISQAESDVSQSYLKHANCYITKPVDLDEFVDIVRRIENFWFSIVTLPS